KSYINVAFSIFKPIFSSALLEKLNSMAQVVGRKFF
ncbi:hypothetical protein TNCV_614341, partial [Trichonephila clavipes]